jgi:hypothetical protein
LNCAGLDAVASDRPLTFGTAVMTDLLIDHVRDELSFLLEHGASLAQLQDQVIERVPGLSEDERAALWLFAWAYRPRGLVPRQRLLETSR